MSAGTVLRIAAFLLVAAALLWFMARDADDAEQAPEDPAPAVSETPAPSITPSAASPSPSPSANGDNRSDVDRGDVDARRKARLDLASDAARAFARPSPATTQQQWWARLRPLIAPSAVENFEHVDAQRVPFTKITARPRLEPTAAPETLLTLVRVPTDAGDYAVEVEDAEDGPGVTAIYPWRDQDGL